MTPSQQTKGATLIGHGGKREGAGRPATGARKITKPVRMSEDMISAIERQPETLSDFVRLSVEKELKIRAKKIK